MEKTGVIHSKLLVYYYYQFVYKLVYYNNTENARLATRRFRPVLTLSSRIRWQHFAEPRTADRYRIFKRFAKRFSSAFLPVLPNPLWKSRGISTGPNVQNTVFSAEPENCPSSVQTPHTRCPAGKRDANSLILWSKRELSTEDLTFTIYY